MAETEDTTRQVDVREVWPHEALHFTPWLAENLDLLGDALGLKLELVQTEAPVGGPPYSCDILAKEVKTGVLVAIENQLEWTDFMHLAQTLIYTVGLKARIAIWVAAEFRYESAEVLNWLNKWTRPEVAFYGVKIEVIKTGESSHEKRLRKVVWPGGWSKDDTLSPAPPPSPRAQQFHDFFRPLTQKMVLGGFADRSTLYYDFTGRYFRSRFDKDIGYAVSLWENGAWVFLHVHTWDSIERNNRIFDTLKKAQTGIEEGIDAEWKWHKSERSYFFTVGIRRDGTIDDPPEKLEETRAWMLDHLPKLKEIFDPRLEKILEKMPAEETSD